MLAIFGGMFGLHRFYVGRWKTGLGMIVTMGGLGFWWLFDLVLIASGEFRDSTGRRVQSWDPGNPLPSSSSHDTAYLTERIEALEHDVNQMAERLDFTERMLTQDRERRALPPTP